MFPLAAYWESVRKVVWNHDTNSHYDPGPLALMLQALIPIFHGTEPKNERDEPPGPRSRAASPR